MPIKLMPLRIIFVSLIALYHDDDLRSTTARAQGTESQSVSEMFRPPIFYAVLNNSSNHSTPLSTAHSIPKMQHSEGNTTSLQGRFLHFSWDAGWKEELVGISDSLKLINAPTFQLGHKTPIHLIRKDKDGIPHYRGTLQEHHCPLGACICNRSTFSTSFSSFNSLAGKISVVN